MNEGQRPDFRGVHRALGTGYNTGRGNRRASKRQRELISHPKPSLTSLYATQVYRLFGRGAGLDVDSVDLAYPPAVKAAVVSVFLLSGCGVAAALQWAFGEATWSVSTGEPGIVIYCHYLPVTQD